MPESLLEYSAVRRKCCVNEMGLFVKEHNLIPNAKPYSKRKTSLLRSKWPQDGPSQKGWRWAIEKSFKLAIGIFCFFFVRSFCQSPKVPLAYEIDTMCRMIKQLVFWNWPFLKSNFFKKNNFLKIFLWQVGWSLIFWFWVYWIGSQRSKTSNP